jgi:hypothetical protein
VEFLIPVAGHEQWRVSALNPTLRTLPTTIFALVDGLLPDCWTKFGAIQISLLANFSFRRP